MKEYALKKQYISVEGNIGSGKSTFLKKLTQTYTFPTIIEPHEKWQNVNYTGNNILESFYSDIKRWAYSFQSYVFLTRIQALQEKMELRPSENFFIAERSVIADRYTFASLCYEAGNMSELEWNMYVSWYEWLVSLLNPIPVGIIYLRTSPEISYKRINVRNRQEESSVPLEYLEQLHDKHDQWLVHKIHVGETIRKIPVLILDCNKDFEKNEKEWSEKVLLIDDFIEKITSHKAKERYTEMFKNHKDMQI